jgi:hypothetical protein
MYWFTSASRNGSCCLSRLSSPSPAEEFRPDLVERVRGEIAAGVYDTPDKWEEALDRLFDRIEQA